MRAASQKLRVEHIRRVFGGVCALNNITMEVQTGEFVVLLGPSGCGKSTLLRIIAGLDKATEGRIIIDNIDMSHAPPVRRGVSMVFQNYALFPHLSVAENIVFGLKARRVPSSERNARLTRAADMLGLTHLLSRKPHQLSGGQQQRVALARAVVAEAPICLMDEPLSNLDAKLRTEMRREIRALQQRLGMTMLYVTHDQAEAMSMGDRIVLMRDGRIEQDASPADMYREPASVFAASFIGTPPMSLLRLSPGAGGAVIRGTTWPIVAPAEAAHAVLGVRPEGIRLTDDGGVAATVLSTEFLGAETVLSCVIGDGPETLQARIPGHHLIATGTPVRLSLPPERHLFDAETGRRLVQPLPRRQPAGLPI